MYLNRTDKKVINDIEYDGCKNNLNVSDYSTLFSSCQALKAWFELSRVDSYRNDLNGNNITSS